MPRNRGKNITYYQIFVVWNIDQHKYIAKLFSWSNSLKFSGYLINKNQCVIQKL